AGNSRYGGASAALFLLRDDLKNLPTRLPGLARVPTIIITAAAAAATAAASATITAVVRFRTRFIDVQGTSANFLAIQSFNCFFGLAAVRHFNKTESTGTPRCPVGYHRDAVDASIRFKKGPKIVFCCGEGEVADEKFHVSASFDSSVIFKRLFSAKIGRAARQQVYPGRGQSIQQQLW